MAAIDAIHGALSLEAKKRKGRDFAEWSWSKWHFTEGIGSFTACGEVVQLFTMDGSPEDGRVQKINCRRCLGVMQRNGFTVAHEG